MEKYKLGDMETRLANMIWSNAPVSSRTLIALCAEAFDWKRTTTYTMLKRLCERNIFDNQNGIVVALMTKEEFGAAQGEQFINDTFNGSLPQFLTAFTRRNGLSDKEITELQRLIDEHKEV